MIKTTLISTAAALLLTSAASGQQIVCAVGYANALSTVGTGVFGTDDDSERGLNRGALMLVSNVGCTGKTFLSDDPSLLQRGARSADNGRRPWDLTFRGASGGLSAALQRFGDFGAARGTADEGRGQHAARLDSVRHAEELGLGSGTEDGSTRPETTCEYLGGTTCDTGFGGESFGIGGAPSGDDIAGGDQAFVDPIQGGSGQFGVGQPDTPGSDPDPGVSDLPVVTVVDLIDEESAAAELAPEPATMTLLASGLIGLAATARRRKSKQS